MMPGTVAERRTEEVKSPVVAPVVVADLTGSERTVALYASDMPTRRRPGKNEQLRTWIAQGVERLGTEELRRRAEFLNGHFLLALSNVVTAQVQARHEQSYPDAWRLEVARQATATSVCFDGMSEAARKRNPAAQVDGECPCGGTRTVGFPGFDPDLSFGIVCPVHGAATIAAHRGVAL